MKENKKTNKAVIIFVAVFLAAVIALGATLGIIYAVKYANAVVTHNGVMLDREVASFFVSLYKNDYLAAVRSLGYNPEADDFWESEYKEEGVSFAEHFDALAESYLKEILVANYIYDSYATLSADARAEIKTVCRDVLELKFDGDEEKFNAEAEKCGFDYDSFCDGVTMYYKSQNAFAAMYGEEGAALSSNPTVCGSYLNEYTHVSLLILRTTTKVTADSSGYYDNDYLSDAERAEQAALIDSVHAALAAYEAGEEGMMTAEAFESWLASDAASGEQWKSTGYYFHPDAEATAELDSVLPGVVEVGYGMENYTFAEVETTMTVTVDDEDIEEKVHVFIYKYPVVDGAYADSEMANHWFSDFYSDAAVYLYTSTVKEMIGGVTYGGYADKLDYSAIEKNIEFIPRF